MRRVAELATPSAAREVDADPQFGPSDRTAARDALVSMVTSLVGKPLRSLEYLGDNQDRLKSFAWIMFNLDEFIYVR